MYADRLVAAHYVGVEVDQLHPVTLNRDLAAYVSFRMHSKVYWTSRRVRLAKGERVFQTGTPGTIGVRERCGNQVSERPRTPVLLDLQIEPSSVVLSNPVPEMPVPLIPTESGPVLITPTLEQQVPATSGSPSGGSVQSGSGGGAGGGSPAGGGGGGGGLASSTPGGQTVPVQPGDLLPPTVYVSGGGPVVNVVGLPVGPPISSTTPAPPGVSTIWNTPPPTQSTPGSTPPGVPRAVPPTVPSFCQWVPVPPSETPPATTPSVPPVVTPIGPPEVTAVIPPPPEMHSSPTPTPEPSTWFMLGTGAALMLIRDRSRRKASASD